MRDNLVRELTDCTEFRQATLSGPARSAHGALALLCLMLFTAVAWAAVSKASLVVRGAGRIRPLSTPVKVFNAERGESPGSGVSGHIIEVNAREGDTVRMGDVLIRLDTRRIDNGIAKQTRAIRAGEDELAKHAILEELLTQQYQATRAKAEAELAQAREDVRRAKGKHDSEVRLAGLALELAERQETTTRRLLDRLASTRTELLDAAAKTREARAKLVEAEIPIDESRIPVAQRSLELAEREFTMKREELRLKREIRRAEVESARIDLDNLELEHARSIIRAPSDGIVTAGDLKIGDVVEPGKPVAEIAQQVGFRFEATVASEEVGHLRAGMPARIKLDAYDYQRYGTLEGTVCFISPDSGVSEGQKTTNYTVRIAIPGTAVGRGAYRGRVKLGMAGQAEVVTGSESLLSLLLKRLRQTIRLG